jgi:glycosyltransferase involved in cell wall biosynthesis
MTHQGDVGGSTNSITWLTRGLAARGHDVFLACRSESLIASRFRDSAVRLLESRWPRGIRLAGEARRWKLWIDEHAIDVVNAHASLDRHLASYVALLGSRAAVVHTRRNVARTTGGWLRGRFDTWTTSAIIAVSQSVADDLVRRGIPRAHLEVIENGVPWGERRPADPTAVARLSSALGLRQGVPVLGVVARRKSQEDLLRAAALLKRPLEIILAGVREDEELRLLAGRLPKSCRVHCLGFRDDVAEILAALDVFVLPSVIEGFSLSLLEAMAAALPCIATDVGGNREALHGGCGLLVRPHDSEALAKALQGLLEDPLRAREMGERARARALAEFDVARTIERTEALYERLTVRE